MKEWVKPGQKIVCIAAEQDWGTGYPYWRMVTPNIPELNQIYTIRDAAMSPDNILGVWLVEIVNPSVPFIAGVFEPNFDVNGFRPLDERKTDISIFTKMLGPQLVDA